MDQDQANRIETKLDRIIRFFNIDQEPRRSNQELERMADDIMTEWQRDGKLKLLVNK